MNKLIAISGDKGAGKSETARLIENILYYRFRINPFVLSFAEPLKRIVAEMLDCHISNLNDPDFKESLTTIAKPDGSHYTVREIMQVTGDKIREINPNFFVNKLFKRVRSHDFVIIDDLRLEFNTIREHGGVVIRIERPGLNNTDTHISETASRQEKYDYTIINDSTLEALREKVAGLILELSNE